MIGSTRPGSGLVQVDRLDNGARASATHLVSWIPPPRLGDATAVGYLRHLDHGRALTRWLPGEQFVGATFRMVFDVHLTAESNGSRLMIRVSGDAAGWSARPVLCFFEVIDSAMARQQLLGIKVRAEAYGSRRHNPDERESGAHDQYQLYETIYAPGGGSGVPGRERAARWREAAIENGVLEFPESNAE